jgi:membrane protein YqaA with SNARE-associated domain
MQRLIAWIQGVLVPTLGPAGLFVVAFLDSSFLSIPEVNDILVISAAMGNPATAWIPVLMATLGSLAGCFALYVLGKRGGEPLLVKRFGEEKTRRARAAFDRYEVLTLAVPAMLPPPMPFKIFVLAAGVFEVPLRRFAITLILARGLRYSLWAVLGMVYGERALELLRTVDSWSARNGPWLLGLAAGVAAATTFYWLRRRRRGTRPPDPVRPAGTV